MHRWPGQFPALDAIVTPESGWDSCAVYPGMHSCGYRGTAACGIPQANPCTKTAWGRSGDLYGTRFAQVRWLLRYIASRYGDPQAALTFRNAHGWY